MSKRTKLIAIKQTVRIRAKMKMIGHRGVCGLEAENTLASVERAIALGLKIVEVDVYCVAGRLLCIHDDTVERTTNGRGGLYDLGLEALRELNAGNGERIPFLDEVLGMISEKCCLNIEIKGEGVATVLVQLLENFPQADILVSSFDWPQLELLRKLDKTIDIAVLTDGDEPWESAKELGAVAVNPSIEMVDYDFVAKAHGLGLKVYSYTVRTKAQWNKAVALGIDGVFVDDPIIFNEQFGDHNTSI